jgi:tetratricopeptide (TPR) repeat protein
LWELDRTARDPLAQRILQTLLQLDDRDRHKPYALYLKGLAFRAMERYRDASVPLEEAAELDPDDIHVWLALGWCYKRSGQLTQAIEALNRALAVDPGQAIIHYNLACYWSLAGSVEVAVEHLATALEIDPRYQRLVASEHDFDSIRNHPAFREVLSVVV